MTALSAADQTALDALVEHGSPYADLFEREARRDAVKAEAARLVARTKPGRLFFNGMELTQDVPGWQFAPELIIPRVRMARTETRRPRRGLLRRAWEWVTASW